MEKKIYTKSQIKNKITAFDALNIGAMQSYMRVSKDYNIKAALLFMEGIYNKQVPDYIVQMLKQSFAELAKKSLPPSN